MLGLRRLSKGATRGVAVSAVLYAALAVTSLADEVSLTFSGHLNTGGTQTSGLGISRDGRYVIGSSRAYPANELGFRWDTHAGSGPGAMVGLGDLPGGLTRSSGYGISADGAVAVGTSASSSGQFTAFRWTPSGGMTQIGDLPGGPFQSNAWNISGDGSVAVGSGFSADGARAWAWTEGGGFETLNLLSGAISGEARNVSYDGRYVTVNSFVRPDPNSPTTLVPSIYDRQTGTHIHQIPAMTPGKSQSIYALADDASAAAGTGTFIDEEANQYSTAYHWTEDDGTVSLGILGGADTGASIVRQSEAFAMSADGRVVVGSSTDEGRFFEAFVWDAEHGMRSLEDIVRDAGIDLDKWWLERATGISADGRFITGFATYQDVNSNLGQQAFVLMIPEPAVGLSLIAGLLLALRRR